ncbi:MAG: sigma 54-interacting transcriptional regulator [Myxococcaceae bacterium]|nr:sigma 54-interacting transcriptional regulator [Myxococcaceae bacterium]
MTRGTQDLRHESTTFPTPSLRQLECLCGPREFSEYEPRMPEQPSSTVDLATGSDSSDRLTAAVRVKRLVCVHGADQGRIVFADTARRVVFGRAPEGPDAVLLDDAATSRQHFALLVDAQGAVHVEDLGSRNGTWLDGARATTRLPLRDGSVVRAGSTVFVFEDVELPPNTRLVPLAPGVKLLGDSLALQRLRGELATVAPSGLPVLVLGDTGVGKERVAEELHRLSGRSGAFVALNCASLTAQLAESELFGHVAGAFTGAQKAHDGMFVAATGGTLFLDELGELPLELQPRLLRALADGEVRPVGSPRAQKVDVRFVAATLRDLTTAVSERTFREDLYARLQAWTVRVPPLRERKVDVLAIGRHFFQSAGVESFTADVAEALLLHDWPWNVRELEQMVRVCAVQAGGKPVRREHLPVAFAARLQGRTSDSERTGVARRAFELMVPRDATPDEAMLRLALQHFAGNVAELAAWFQKDRKQVYRWLERASLDPDAFREPEDP